MSLGEKTQVTKSVRDDLGYHFPGIEKTPGVCGESACIVRTVIPVWLLVEAQQAGAKEADLLKSYPSHKGGRYDNTSAYFRANKEEIDSTISENEAIEGEYIADLCGI